MGLGSEPYGRGARRGRIFLGALLPGMFAGLLLGAGFPSAWAAAEKARQIDVEQLAAMVADADRSDRARVKVAQLLAESKDPRALKYLFEAIDDSGVKPVLRAAWVQTLDRSPQRPPVAKFLTGLLKNPREPSEIRAAAARVLGPLGWPESQPVLKDAASDPDPAVRLAATTALLAHDEADVDRVALLIAILAESVQPGSARADAARGLGASKDPRALSPLRAALLEELPHRPESSTPGSFMQRNATAKGLVPIAAARALGELGEPAAAPDLLAFAEAPAAEMRVAVFEALARLKSGLALDAARRALVEDEDQRVRRWAAMLLKELKNPEALPELRRALKQDPDPGVRLQAVQALEVLQDQEAMALISTALPKEELKELRAAMEQALTSLAGSAAESSDADGNAPKTN